MQKGIAWFGEKNACIVYPLQIRPNAMDQESGFEAEMMKIFPSGPNVIVRFVSVIFILHCLKYG